MRRIGCEPFQFSEASFVAALVVPRLHDDLATRFSGAASVIRPSANP